MQTSVEHHPASMPPRDWRELAFGMLLILASVATSAALTFLARTLTVGD